MNKADFDAADYWEARHRRHRGLDAVGFLGLGDAYNHALYRVKGGVFRRTVKRLYADVSALDVLDVGSGTGFVLQQWLDLGARQPTGSDLSEFAVGQLRDAFPDCRFVQMDIGSADALERHSPASFDCVSALDVLYHIVDDDRYRQALRNIGALLRPGGRLLLADNFLHRTTQRSVHQVSHSLQTLEAWLDAAGMTIEHRVPQAFLMNYPVDSDSRFLHAWWKQLSAQVARSERRGAWLGRGLVPVDLFLTQVFREGPTTELAVCTKRAAPSA